MNQFPFRIMRLPNGKFSWEYMQGTKPRAADATAASFPAAQTALQNAVVADMTAAGETPLTFSGVFVSDV